MATINYDSVSIARLKSSNIIRMVNFLLSVALLMSSVILTSSVCVRERERESVHIRSGSLGRVEGDVN